MLEKMNQKIVFNEDGEIVKESKVSKGPSSSSNKRKFLDKNGSNDANHGVAIKSRNFSNGKRNNKEGNNEKWFEKFAEFNFDEIVEQKENELLELTKICKSCFETELPRQAKNNPSDAKWLETALYKGTAKDKANAGALLVYSNPLGNLSALQTLIGYSKHSNKANTDVIATISELFIEGLLPSNRKLLSLEMRGGDWKALKKRDDITNDIKNQIYAYWYFENELKEHYFEFLKNLQHCIQTGQDANKNIAIINATKLLTYSPEKEQMLLSMLINKLGDPSSKVASKALHHLIELIYKHPNMCGVITNETEKLLFRNNISEKAQHFALCFLSQISLYSYPDVCTKLVNICFSYFKILVKKGSINNKMMQAILRCLQKSIINVKSLKENNNEQLMTKEMQDTIYRLVHLADIKISIQTLSLLLQLITIKNENSDRYYNALYKKLLDINLITIGNNIAGQFLHILHRSIHIDQNITRAQAFIKRLLQISLYMPSHITCGILIIINKLLKIRPELLKFEEITKEEQKYTILIDDKKLDKFNDSDDDGEEKYEDVRLDDENENNREDVKTENEDSKLNGDVKIENIKSSSSWYHAKLSEIKIENETKQKITQIVSTSYDPYHRVPAYAGAEYTLKSELILLLTHFHPTVKVFAENILNNKKIDYYGDPLKDFALTHFLERFSFKNPKKINDKNTDSVIHMFHNKSYIPYGTRGQSIKSLNKNNCTEDEFFIFNYLEKKRENHAKLLKLKEETDDNNEEIEDVDDDEFEEYLNSLCKKAKNDNDNDEDFDLDYMKEFEDGNEKKKIQKKKKDQNKKDDNEGDSDDESDTIENDWGDDDEDIGSDYDEIDEEGEDEDENIENDLNASISGGESDDIDDDESIPEIEEDDDDELDDGDFDDEEEQNEESEDDQPKRKKQKKSSDNFNKVLKNQTDMSSLFAAADDFAELLENTGKQKGHGTLNAVFNKDKSSDKQLKWEEKRRSGLKNFHSNSTSKGKFKKFGKNKKK